MELSLTPHMMDTEKLGSRLDVILHKFATREEENNDNDNILSEVTSLTQIIETMVASSSSSGVTETGKDGGVSFPVKTLEELRFYGSACWNMTVRYSTREESAEERTLKASLRYFATKSFLIGNYAYASSDVSHSYFTHHPREAEQCVLMCLKTSRDLSLCDMPKNAKHLLLVGETIATYIHTGVRNSLSQLKHRNMSWEFGYTNMDITWNMGHYQESCEAGKKLAQMLLKNQNLLRDHREAFFRFIFTIGNNSDNVPQSAECHIRDMLQCSLDVQSHFEKVGTSNNPSHHMVMLHGVTLEQMALSWLREGKATQAVPWAVEADTILHSNVSALLRLRAIARAGMEEEAVLSLHHYVERSDVSTDDAVSTCFELHKLLVNMKEGSIEAMRLLYQKTKQNTSNESIIFRFTQLLLHNGTLSSCREALHILRTECIDFEEVKYRRYCFMWLWELSDTVNFLPTEVVDCLETVLRFKDCASDNEMDSIHLRLCTEYIAQAETDTKTRPHALSKVKNILHYYITERNHKCIFAHTLLFKLSVLGGNADGDGNVGLERELNSLLQCEPTELIMPALCTVINYSLKHNCLHAVALVTTRALFSSIPIQEPSTELELLRVYVASLLSKVCTCTDEQLCMMTQRFQTLLADECARISLSHDEVLWWSQAFLVLGSEFTDGPAYTSVCLFRAATRIALQDPSPSEGASRNFLIAGLICTLENEFQLFASGKPQMNISELEEDLHVCKDILTSLPDMSYHLTALLAEGEQYLRQPSHETSENIQRIINELSNVHATFEDVEALADGASFMALQYASDYPFLHSVTIKLYMEAVNVLMNNTLSTTSTSLKSLEEDVEKTAGYITDALSCFYKSFSFAFDRTEQFALLQRLMELLSLSIEDVTVTSFIKNYTSNKVLGATNHSLSFALLFLEFFTVEAWNNSVFYLHLTETVNQTRWAHIAWTLADTLPETSNIASALLALKAATSV